MVTNLVERIFREKTIYVRSDNIVRFIKLSPRTQIAMFSVLLIAHMWIAYSSVNVIYKEQIALQKQQIIYDQNYYIKNLKTKYDRIFSEQEYRITNITTRIVEHCNLKGCAEEDLKYILRGNTAVSADVFCWEDIPYEIRCKDMLTQSRQIGFWKSSYASIINFTKNIYEYINGEEVENESEIRLFFFENIIRLIILIVTASFAFILGGIFRTNRPATLEDIENLRDEITKRNSSTNERI